MIHVDELTPEAGQVLKYLVLHYTSEDRATFDQIEQNTKLHGMDLSDAIAELEERNLVEEEHHHVRVLAHAWEVAGKEVVGFDVQADALEVARATNDIQGKDEHGWVEAKQLEEATGLSVDRLNTAALWLQEEDKLTLLQTFGARPYAFSSAQARYQTRKWLRSQAV